MKQSTTDRPTPSFCSFSEAYNEYSHKSDDYSGKEYDQQPASGNGVTRLFQRIVNFIKCDIFQSRTRNSYLGDVRA